MMVTVPESRLREVVPARDNRAAAWVVTVGG